MTLFPRRKQNAKVDLQEQFVKELYGQHYGFMKNTAMKILNNPSEAEDMIQDVFLLIITKIDQIMQYENYQIKNYLYIALRGRCLNLLRLKTKQSTLESSYLEDEFLPLFSEQSYSAEETYFEKLSINELGNLMKKVPENYRNAFYLKYEFGYSDKEIAKIMKIKQQCVRVYANRAEKMLHTLIHEGTNHDEK